MRARKRGLSTYPPPVAKKGLHDGCPVRAVRHDHAEGLRGVVTHRVAAERLPRLPRAPVVVDVDVTEVPLPGGEQRHQLVVGGDRPGGHLREMPVADRLQPRLVQGAGIGERRQPPEGGADLVERGELRDVLVRDQHGHVVEIGGREGELIPPGVGDGDVADAERAAARVAHIAVEVGPALLLHPLHAQGDAVLGRGVAREVPEELHGDAGQLAVIPRYAKPLEGTWKKVRFASPVLRASAKVVAVTARPGRRRSAR
jgi:hypothetical protein